MMCWWVRLMPRSPASVVAVVARADASISGMPACSNAPPDDAGRRSIAAISSESVAEGSVTTSSSSASVCADTGFSRRRSASVAVAIASSTRRRRVGDAAAAPGMRRPLSTSCVFASGSAALGSAQAGVRVVLLGLAVGRAIGATASSM